MPRTIRLPPNDTSTERRRMPPPRSIGRIDSTMSATIPPIERAGRALLRLLLGRRGKKCDRPSEVAAGDRQVRHAGSEVGDRAARDEGADEPADAHRDAQNCESVHEIARADDIVRVTLASRLLDSADDSGKKRERQ